jgi:DNA invertase Pin-like site-specific DNA recombinase
LTLNVLLSFAQFEREVIGERIRDKIAASKKKAGGGVMGVVCRFVTHLRCGCASLQLCGEFMGESYA